MPLRSTTTSLPANLIFDIFPRADRSSEWGILVDMMLIITLGSDVYSASCSE